MPGSTLWYDLEGYDNSNRHCRESALAFLSGWTYQIRRLKYVSGVYSSVGSGILDLDRARANGRTDILLPDSIWLARWDGVANTSSSYISESGWRPGNRVKQYRGGHDETWGGVRINIDSNRLDVGRGSAAYPENHCNGVGINFTTWKPLARPSGNYRPAVDQVKALQCLLTERHTYRGRIHGRYDAGTVAAVRAWQRGRGFTPSDRWTARDWMTVISYGARPVLKFGSVGRYVRRIQRALNAAAVGESVAVSGMFNTTTARMLRKYQSKVDIPVNGLVTRGVWQRIQNGRR